jgi:glycosyl transferase family 1
VKVYVYPGDAWGCGHYRCIFPGQAVAGLGELDVTVIEPGSRDLTINFDQRTGRVVGHTFPDDADVVVMQRPTNGFLSQVVPMLQERGVAVVVDMDDDLGCIHPRNPAFPGLQPKIRVRGVVHPNLHSWHNARDACRIADLVTVTTPALAQRYGSHGRVRVIPNMVPAGYLDIPHTDSDVIGWGGTVGTHPDDLQSVGPSLAKLIQAGATFRQVGDGGGVARCLGLRDEPPSTGPVGLDEWPLHLATFGIGIAPLAMTRFNEAKSRLKPLEYASVGVPWVGAATPDYRALHDLGCGMIAERPKAWEGILRRLLREPALREDLSASGRRVAAENTFEGNAWLWAEAWALAAVNKRGAPLASSRR